jgi:hypothetical protein
VSVVTILGPIIDEESGYRVRQVFDCNQGQPGASVGFTFEGPGFNALIIYPTADEAFADMRAMIAPRATVAAEDRRLPAATHGQTRGGSRSRS